ncbi:MAG: hypothetical protein U0326_32770 [Polyangiales bacterium]
MFTDFDFGDEFINVSPVGGGVGVQSAMTPVAAGDLPPERQRKARENAAGLRRAIERARSYYLVTPGIGATRVLRPGGIVYFPPGRYLIARPSTPPPSDIPGDVRSDIVVPPEVTLWFAPGAVLVPLGDEEPRLDGLPPAERRKVYIEIQGDIIAGIQQIFDVAVNAADTAHTAGEIILTSLRVRELYPEWWGASSLPADLSPTSPVMWRTTMAMQAAFDAAYNHRSVRGRRSNGAFLDGPAVYDRRLPSIPVVLKGVYDINGELFIGVPNSELDAAGAVPSVTPVPLGGFELRGENAIYAPSIRAGKAIVRHSVSSPSEPIARENSGTMLTIRGPVSFAIRNVNFDGNYRAATCVAVEPVVGDWGYSTFEGCNFNACRHTVVRLDAERRRRSASAQSKRDFWNITFSRCHFFVIDTQAAERTVHAEGGAPSTTDAITQDISVTLAPYSFDEGTIIAVDVDLKENEGLEFRNCFFLHVASPAIRAVSGRFALNETLFHVIRPPVPFEVRDPTYGRNDSRHGTDISIEAREAGGTSTAPDRLVPATFTALECETHSVQFVATHDTPPGFSPQGQTRSATVLMNVVSSHEVVSEFHRAGESASYDNWYVNHGAEPPAIYWSHPGTVGCALIMVGCAFTGPRNKGGKTAVSRSNQDWSNKNRRVVYLGPISGGYVYDLASNLIEVAPGDPPSWNDVIFNGNTSVMSGDFTLALRPNPGLIRRFSPLRFDEFL